MAGDFPEHPPLVVGGIQAVTWQLSTALMRAGDVHVDVLAVEKWLQAKAWRTRVRQQGIDVEYIRSPRSVPEVLTARTSDAWTVRLRAARLRPDLIHAHSMVGYSVGAIKSALPHVITLHGIATREKTAADSSWRSALRERAWADLENWVLRNAKHLIVISPYVLNSIAARTGAALHVIPNGVSEEYFELARKPSEAPTILSVGWLVPRKRHDLLIRAIALVHQQRADVRLRIVGSVPPHGEDYANKLGALVRDLGLEDVVRIESGIPQARLADYYASSWLLAHCASEESSPMAVAQALASGLPVIATDIPGVSHLVHDDANGYRVGIRDETSLAAKILDAVQSPALLERLSHTARSQAAGYSQRHVASQTAQLYKEILAAR